MLKDIPFFTTQYGVASLTLREIPYTGRAFIRIQQSNEPEALLREVCGFCRAAGGEKIYATGDPVVEAYPFYTTIWQLFVSRSDLGNTDAVLVPVTKDTVCLWRDIYNHHMKDIPNHATITLGDAEAIQKRNSAYFVHKADARIGIGMAGGAQIEVVVSEIPGAGRDVVLALNTALTGEIAVVEVASNNERAIRLYEGLGFTIVRELARWYKIQ